MVDSTIRRRRTSEIRSGPVVGVVALAVKHQLSRDGIKLTPKEARTLSEQPSLKVDARIVAYAWELERRAVGKSKGAVDHKLWRSIPFDHRKSLTALVVEQARARLRSAATDKMDENTPGQRT